MLVVGMPWLALVCLSQPGPVVPAELLLAQVLLHSVLALCSPAAWG